MAIVINPDGTVSTIETTHDQYGNLRAKIDSDLMKEQTVEYNKNTISVSKEKSGYIYPTGTVTKKYRHKVNISQTTEVKRQYFFVKTIQIDKFFNRLLNSGKWLSPEIYQKTKESLSDTLQPYFASKYQEYLEQRKKQGVAIPNQATPQTTKKQRKQQVRQQQIEELEEAMKRTTFSKPKVKKKKKIPQFVKEVKAKYGSSTANTIGEIATFGTLKEKYASSQDFDVRTSNPPRPARAPKYAYARHRYGRVQERDSFNEEKRNEFYVAHNRQKNYDYSNYDANDDNDGAYSEWD